MPDTPPLSVPVCCRVVSPTSVSEAWTETDPEDALLNVAKQSRVRLFPWSATLRLPTWTRLIEFCS